MLFDRKPDKLLSRTLYRTRVAAHVILKLREEDVMNNALFAPLSNYIYRERANKLTGIYCAPPKPRSDRMEPSDFDKCESIYCKITHK